MTACAGTRDATGARRRAAAPAGNMLYFMNLSLDSSLNSTNRAATVRNRGLWTSFFDKSPKTVLCIS